MKITTVGLDLAKNVFHVVCVDEGGHEVKKRMLRRNQLIRFFSQLEACRVGMEACGGSHYWARRLSALGHEPVLVPAQHVKPLVAGNKNDYNDAWAILEALGRKKIHFVRPKRVEEQDLQALHRIRRRCVDERTKLVNSTRGLLTEYGIVFNRGVSAFRREIPRVLEDGENGLSEWMRRWLSRAYEQLGELEAHIRFYDQELKAMAQQEPACERLQEIPGYGVVLASAFFSMVGDGSAYRRGRDVSATLGVVPAHSGTGGKIHLLGISKRGDRYLRSLLIQGAKSVVSRAKGKTDRLSVWINRIREERGENKACVALANKMARIGWALLRSGGRYQPA